MTSDAVCWYDQNISVVSPRYESVAAETVHRWLVDLLPNAPALVLDVGAGTGRDAAWLASRGLEVIAVEPSGAMRAEAQRLHPSQSIQWIADSLPSLNHVLRLGLSFDMILLSAVWMHVLPAAHPCFPQADYPPQAGRLHGHHPAPRSSRTRTRHSRRLPGRDRTPFSPGSGSFIQTTYIRAAPSF